MDQRLTRLEHDARQPRLTMEADGPANTKTRERTKGTATADEEMNGDSCTAQKVQHGPKTSTCFGMMAEPPDLHCRDDVVVESGDAAPKSCLPSLKMRTTTAAGGLLPTGKTSTATTTFNESPLRFYATEETNPKEKKFKDFNFIRLVRRQLLETACCPLLPESYRDKIQAKWDVRSWWFSRSSPCLPVSGIVARAALW